jgi:hypothetical protein
VIVDPSLLEQSRPKDLRKPEVGHVVAVQVADLPSSDLERELPAPAGSRQHTSFRAALDAADAARAEHSVV